VFNSRIPVVVPPCVSDLVNDQIEEGEKGLGEIYLADGAKIHSKYVRNKRARIIVRMRAYIYMHVRVHYASCIIKRDIQRDTR